MKFKFMEDMSGEVYEVYNDDNDYVGVITEKENSYSFKSKNIWLTKEQLLDISSYINNLLAIKSKKLKEKEKEIVTGYQLIFTPTGKEGWKVESSKTGNSIGEIYWTGEEYKNQFTLGYSSLGPESCLEFSLFLAIQNGKRSEDKAHSPLPKG